MAVSFPHFRLRSPSFSPFRPLPTPVPTRPNTLQVISTSIRTRPINHVTTRKKFIVRASDEDGRPENAGSESTPESETQPAADAKSDEMSQLGSEIKKAMEERERAKEGDFWSGVAEEIREIEWPAFNKVLGTTGVVIGVIVGSSIVLLTVNAVLAEISDGIFAGRGIQDFFG